MNINTYLMFGGNCEEAFKFYESLLGGKITNLKRFSDGPDAASMPDNVQQKVLHVHMEVAGQALMGSDCPPKYPHQGCRGMQVSIGVASVEEAERVFAALSEGGEVTMPIQPTFWSPSFGMTVDRFGVPWMIGCDAEVAS